MTLKFLYINFVSILFLSCTGTMNNKNEGEKFIIGKINDNNPVSVIASVKEGSDFLYPNVFLGNEVVYTDSTPTLYNLKEGDNRVITLKKDVNHSYILLEIADPPLSDKWIVLSIVNNKLVAHYKVIKDIIEDIDNDGFLEVGGMEVNEAYCVDCDSAYYNPYQMYKLADKFEFDKIASERLTKQLYGVYLGKERVDTVLKIVTVVR